MNYYNEYEIREKHDCKNIHNYTVKKVCYYPVFEAIVNLTDPTSATENNETIVIKTIEWLNRALFGDIVQYDCDEERVIAIEKQYEPEIVGIVHASSIVTYGENHKGVPFYLFRPLNKNYPNFLVAYDKKKHGKRDLFVVIKRQSWPASKKNPIGQIVEYIGEPGIYSNEIEAVLVRYDLHRKNVPNRILREETLPSLLNNDIVNRDIVDLTDKEVFSIDPENCEDIDDALHFEPLTQPHAYKVGVHIANPAFYLPQNGKHDTIVQNRLTSIYTPLHRVDMLHPELAIKSASLTEGKQSLVNSVIFTVTHDKDKPDCSEITNVEFVSCLVVNRYNLSYDAAQEIYDRTEYQGGRGLDEFESKFHAFYQVSDDLARQYLPTFKDGITDVHGLVEAWMLLANWYTGQELVKRYQQLAPLRVLKCSSFTNPTALLLADGPVSKLSMIKMQRQLQIRQSAAAEYRLYDPQNSFHSALQLSQYTHFTSPIRRYIDIIVHRLLFPKASNFNNDPIIGGCDDGNNNAEVSGCTNHNGRTQDHSCGYTKESLTSLLDKINNINRRVRKAERAFDRLRIVNTLSNSGVTETETMIVVDIYAHGLELWSDRWQTTIKLKLIPRLLKQRYQLDPEGNLIKKYACQEECVQLHKFNKMGEVLVKSCVSAKGCKMELSHVLLDPPISLT
jgi:exoribonuclease R